MKILTLLSICAVLSVCWSRGVVELDVVLDPEADAPAASSSSSASDSSSESDSASSSASESDSASDSSASNSASSFSSESVSTDASGVIVKRDIAHVIHRKGWLSLTKNGTLELVFELNVACDDMADTEGIVAAYTAYYGRISF